MLCEVPVDARHQSPTGKSSEQETSEDPVWCKAVPVRIRLIDRSVNEKYYVFRITVPVDKNVPRDLPLLLRIPISREKVNVGTLFKRRFRAKAVRL